MIIRWKFFYSLLFISISILIISISAADFFILGNFKEIENSQATHEVNHIVNLIKGDIEAVKNIGTNESQWDAAYQFALHQNEDFLENDVMALNDLKLDLIVYTNRNNEVIYARELVRETNTEQPLSENLTEIIIRNTSLLPDGDLQNGIEGIAMIGGRPIILAIQPILNSQAEGPRAGVLIIGRWLGSHYLNSLTQKVGTEVSFEFPAAFTAKDEISSLDIQVSDSNRDWLICKSVLMDIQGNPTFVIVAKIYRDIYLQGRKSISYFILTFSLGVFLSGCIIYVLANRWLTAKDQAKMLRDKAIRAAQLASAGEIATMIAHEINNPLSGVIGCAEISLNRACDHCGNKEVLERIIHEGERIAKMVSGLLTFSYDPGNQKSLQKIEPIISRALALIKPLLDKKDIFLETDLSGILPEIQCNPQQIEQVIFNIVRNAYQALEEGVLDGHSDKTINVAAGKIKKDHKNYLQIKISNNGPNIKKELLDKVDQPFFTTKPSGTGTGLGLSISKDIMKIHDGSLEIRSEPGELTEITLFFPIRH